MKKKLLLMLTLVFVFVCMLAISANAVVIDDVDYTLNASAGTAQVSQVNQTLTYEIANIPESVEYEGTTYLVTSIAESAFQGNTTVKEIRILSPYITTIPKQMITNTSGGALEKIYINFSNITTFGYSSLNPSSNAKGDNPVVSTFYYYDAVAFANDGSSVKITNPAFKEDVTFEQAAFQGSNFETLIIPAGATISNGGQVFRKCTMKTLIVKGERTKIPLYTFAHLPNIEHVRVESTTLETLETNAFHCNKSPLTFTIDLSNVTSIGGNALELTENAQNNSPNMVTQWYDLNGNKVVNLRNVKTLSGQCLASANLGSVTVIWPEALQSIGDQVFRKSNIKGTVYLNMEEGKTASIASWAFNGDGNTPDIIICGNGITGFNVQNGFKHALTFVMLNDTVTNLPTSLFKTAGSVLYAKSLPNDASEYGSNVTVNMISDGYATYSVCGVTATVTLASDSSEVTVGEVKHQYSDELNNDLCPIGKVYVHTCITCGTSYITVDGEPVQSAPSHDYDLENGAVVVGINYNGNYFGKGTQRVKCASCESVADGAKVDAIFVYAGYAYTIDPMTGAISITQSYKLNRAVYTEYKDVLDISFGVVVATETGAPDVNKPVDETGNQKIKVTDLTNTQMQFARFEIKVSDIVSANANVGIIACAYVTQNGTTCYLTNGASTETADYKTVNEIIEMLEI